MPSAILSPLPMKDYLEIFKSLDPPFQGDFEDSLLGPEFDRELDTVRRMWTECGYKPGVGACLTFFLLRDFLVMHEDAAPPRFASFRSMADSFHRTDLFIREVTDSGREPTGGISSPRVRGLLHGIMRRHERVAIPIWMMVHFGFSLTENVEKQCPALEEEDKRLHLSYMAKTFRIMGIPFTEDRASLERFSRAIEREHVGLSPNAERHVLNILVLGEMVGVSSGFDRLNPILPDPTRALFKEIYPRVRPRLPKRFAARYLGPLLMKRAVGPVRKPSRAPAAA